MDNIEQANPCKVNYFTTSDEIKLRYIEYPADPEACVLFLHGVGGDAKCWEFIQYSLWKTGISSIALDLRGHGLSGNAEPPDSFRVERFAQDILEFIESTNYRHVYIVGHSLGGIIGLLVAAKQIRKLTGMVLIDTSDRSYMFGLSPQFQYGAAQLMRWLGRLQKSKKPRKKLYVRPPMRDSEVNPFRIFIDIHATSPFTYFHTCSSVFYYDYSKLLSKISIPTLVISGEEDRFLPPVLSQDMARRIPGAQFKLVPQADHIIVTRKPRELTEIIRTWVQANF